MSSTTTESPAAEAARKRREKLLAKADARMKLVSGEKVELNPPATPSTPQPALSGEPSSPAAASAAAVASPTTTVGGGADTVTPVKEDTRPRWEKKWEQNVAAVTEKREVPAELLSKLDVTQSMAVEAPRAAAAAAELPKHVPVMSLSSRLPFGKVRLDSLLTSLTAIWLGCMSGMTNGRFITQNIWLPFGSFLLFALLFRVLLSTSLRRLNLVKPQPAVSSGGMLSTALAFLPRPITALLSNVSMVSGFVKDSYDDMMLFVFAHGLASMTIMAKLQTEAATKATSMQFVQEEQEYVSLM